MKSSNQKTQQYQDAYANHKALEKLKKYSTGKNVRYDFHGIGKHSEVYVQGHGQPGQLSIDTGPIAMNSHEAGVRYKQMQDKMENGRAMTFDPYQPKNPYNNMGTFKESVTAKRTAKVLKDMGLSDKSKIRFNSCYSAAQNYPLAFPNHQSVKHAVDKGSLSHGNDKSSQTFGGAVLQELNKKRNKNLYHGQGVKFPTYQHPQYSIQAKGQPDKFMSVQVPVFTPQWAMGPYGPYQPQQQYQNVRRSVAYIDIPNKK